MSCTLTIFLMLSLPLTTIEMHSHCNQLTSECHNPRFWQHNIVQVRISGTGGYKAWARMLCLILLQLVLSILLSSFDWPLMESKKTRSGASKGIYC